MDDRQYKDSMRYIFGALIGISLMLIAFLLSGCKSPVILTHERIDSVYIEKLIPVELPADSATIQALLECDENGKVVLGWLDMANTKNAKLEFSLDSLGYMKSKTVVKRDTLYLPSKETTVFKDKIIDRIVEVEKKLNWWQQLRIYLGNLLLIGTTGAILWLIIRKRLK